jgi:outer membrane biosynthesis protein TonB
MKKHLIIGAISILLIACQINFSQEKSLDVKVGIINGRATHLPSPEYPQEAEDSCASGLVKVAVAVEIKNFVGNVISAKAISGNEILRKSAEEAALKAKFRKTDDVDERKVSGFLVYNFEPKIKCVETGIVNNKAISLPKPRFANLSHLNTDKDIIVAVQITVDMDGKVKYAKALTGHPLLRPACEMSARRAKFAPILIQGSPILVKALLVYKFKPDRMIETDIEKGDKAVIGTAIKLVKPPSPFCNCRFGGNQSVSVEAKIDKQGNVTSAKAYSGHPILKNISEKAALASKFLPLNINAKIMIVYEFEAINNNREVKFNNIYVKEIEIEE